MWDATKECKGVNNNSSSIFSSHYFHCIGPTWTHLDISYFLAMPLLRVVLTSLGNPHRIEVTKLPKLTVYIVNSLFMINIFLKMYNVK